MSQVIFHLGYPKTGTTYLQRKYFTQLQEKYAVVTPEFENLGVTIQKLQLQLHRRTIPANIIQKLEGRPLLFSLEGLLLEPMRQFFEPDSRRPSFPAALEGLRALAGDTPEGEIDMVIYLRAQPDLLHSLYVESKTYLFDAQPGLRTIEGYAENVMRTPTGPQDAGWYYDFCNTLREIRQGFPKAALHVRFYEALASAPQDEVAFWSHLTETSLDYRPGRENNRAQGSGSKTADAHSLHVSVVRLKNRIVPDLKLPNRLKFLVRDTLKRIGKGEGVRVDITEDLRDRLARHFSAINAGLATAGVEIPEPFRAAYLGVPEVSQ